jgi:phosphoglycolate phosphatase
LGDVKIKFRAILFDLDGTLLDTLEDLADAMNLALAEMGFPIHHIESYKYFVGDGIENEARRALPPDAGDETTVKKCVTLARDNYSRCWTNNTRPYPGIPELLTGLQNKNIPLTVLSNKPDDFTRLMVKELLSKWKFEIVLGAGPNTPVKPNPLGAVQIAQRLALPAEQFVYAGDTNTDMQTANSAGMYAVGVLWGFRTARELLDNGAKQLAINPTDILKLFEK